MLQNEPLVKISKDRSDLSVSSIVNTKTYRDAFDAMPVPKPVAQSAYEQAGRILQKTNGTEFEHMVAINARTGALVADNLSRRPSARRTGFDPDEAAKVLACPDGVVAIHNHPASKPPSYRDIMTAAENKRLAASVVIGHDGSVWYVSIADTRIAVMLESFYNMSSNQYGERAETKAVADLLEDNKLHRRFTWRRLR